MFSNASRRSAQDRFFFIAALFAMAVAAAFVVSFFVTVSADMFSIAFVSSPLSSS
jgi:hypothetical protein